LETSNVAQFPDVGEAVSCCPLAMCTSTLQSSHQVKLNSLHPGGSLCGWGPSEKALVGLSLVASISSTGNVAFCSTQLWKHLFCLCSLS
jgi:hypothetical protein